MLVNGTYWELARGNGISRGGTQRHRCRRRVGPAPSRDSNVRGQKRRRRSSLLLGRLGSRACSTSRSELQQRVIKIMADERLDAIMFPHQKRLVVPIGETQVERNGALGSVTGFPSIVVPGGFSSPTPTATLGVPVGIEFLGRPWSEKLLVEIGYGYEQATKHRRPPPTIPPLLAARHPTR
jgi:Asp-tRNA(Asn)/Glu-tRNA(Gln) amidotransferase A subunit family amidase